VTGAGWALAQAVGPRSAVVSRDEGPRVTGVEHTLGDRPRVQGLPELACDRCYDHSPAIAMRNFDEGPGPRHGRVSGVGCRRSRGTRIER